MLTTIHELFQAMLAMDMPQQLSSSFTSEHLKAGKNSLPASVPAVLASETDH